MKTLFFGRIHYKFFFTIVLAAVVIVLCASCTTGQNQPAETAQSYGAPLPASSVPDTPSTSILPETSITAVAGSSPTKSLFSVPGINILLSNQSLKNGNAFKVTVELGSGKALRGAQWQLKFNPEVMQLKNISEGSFFKDWAAANNGTTIVLPKPVIDNSKGSVSQMGIAVMSNGSGGVTGYGILCIYDFVALSDQVETPVVSDMVLVDVNGNTFPLNEIAN
jgi:hypothetical protein